MKRLISFVVVMLVFVVVVVAGPAERFTRVYGVVLSASTTQQVVPTYNGAAFQPDKASVWLYIDSGDATVTIRTYLPHDSGPISATDSVDTVFFIRGLGDGMWDWHYYGPFSDTMQVITSAASSADVKFFGW